MAKGMTNALADADSYRWIGKEATLTFKRYQSLTASSYTGNPNFKKLSASPQITITEIDRRYGYYQGKKSYTTGDVVRTNDIDPLLASGGVTGRVTLYTPSECGLGANEYFLTVQGHPNSQQPANLASIPICETAGDGISINTTYFESIEIGKTGEGNKVMLHRPTADSSMNRTIECSKSGTVKLAVYEYIVNEYDMSLVESGGGEHELNALTYPHAIAMMGAVA